MGGIGTRREARQDAATTLAALAVELASDNGDVAQGCADAALDLCGADTTGVSLAEPGGLRWLRAAGTLRDRLVGWMPREPDPVGRSLGPALRFERTDRVSSGFGNLGPRGHDTILARFGPADAPLGHVWAIRHDPDARFSIEDARRLCDLAGFAAAGHRLAESESGRAEAHRLEERFRQFGKASSDVLWIRNARTLDWEYLSPAFERVYGFDRSAAFSGDGLRTWMSRIVPDDRRRVAAEIDRVRRGERAEFEYRIIRADGELRWLRNTKFPLNGASGRIERIGGITRDTTEERRAADSQRMLVAELQHRTRNLLGVVRSVATRTLETSASLAEFQTRFDERLNALARVNGLLSRLDDDDRISFHELLQTEFSGLGIGGQQVTLAGPADVFLRSSTVQTVALALHELTTNAIKHGALRRRDGRLRVAWDLGTMDGMSALRVDWQERGVRVDPAGPGGYGRQLIEGALPHLLGARVRYDLGADGLVCILELPAATLARAPDA